MYDAQLALLLDDEASSGLSNEDMEILGELEGMLQVRGAAAALQRRTEPLYRELAAEALAAAFESPEQETPTSLMGKLAVRQQELKVPAPDGKAILICEARRLAAERLASAAELMGSGKEAEALATAAKVAEYATFIGAGLCGLNLAKDVADPTPTSVAERYLGALTIPPEVAQAAQALAKAAAAADAEGAGLTNALFAMSDPETAAARDKYAAALDGSVSAGDFSSSAAAKHAALASELSLPPAVSQRLGLDAYYGWLSDASERADLDAVETAETARSCLAITLAGVAELYANTNVDELALTTAVEQLLAESNDGTLSADAQQRLSYVETQLAARAGVASGVVSAATAD